MSQAEQINAFERELRIWLLRGWHVGRRSDDPLEAILEKPDVQTWSPTLGEGVMGRGNDYRHARRRLYLDETGRVQCDPLPDTP